MVLAFDVTERVEAERLLRVQRGSLPRPVRERERPDRRRATWTAALTAVNEAFLRATGYSREELVGIALE